MTVQRVEPGGPLRGRIQVPGDKSISHRMLILAALADGTSTIRGLSGGDDVLRTRRILEALGIRTFEAAGVLNVHGGALSPAKGPLDVGNSGTGIRLLAGLLAGMDFQSVLDGDDSIRRRPMDRVLEPLRAMGATVAGREGSDLAPLTVGGGGLSGIEYRLPVASAQVKGCVLFAGLSADSPTTVIEDRPSRAHTEELMLATGITVDESSEDGLNVTTVHPGRPEPFTHDIAGDPSQAAFWAVAAAIVPGSEVVLGNVYAGPARLGFVEVLQRMGAYLVLDPASGDMTVRNSELVGTDIAADEVPGLVDEVPILAVAAAMAEGVTTFDGVEELRIKESDRLAAVESQLGRMGAEVRVENDRLVVTGRPEGVGLRGVGVDSHGDHRIAMACAVAALVAKGPTTITGWDAVSTSYPDFYGHLQALRNGNRPEVADRSADEGS